MKKEVILAASVSAISICIALASIVVSAKIATSQESRITEAESTIEKLKTVAKAHAESLDSHDEFVKSFYVERINETVEKANAITNRSGEQK